MLSETDKAFLRKAYDEARQGYDEGGLPIGGALAEGGRLIATGRNRRVQDANPVSHGETDCMKNTGRRPGYDEVTIYTTLSPCMMCSGTIVQFAIPRVVVGEAENFPGNPDFLREHGVDVVIADDPDCIALMARFIAEKPELWAEDIAEDD